MTSIIDASKLQKYSNDDEIASLSGLNQILLREQVAALAISKPEEYRAKRMKLLQDVQKKYVVYYKDMYNRLIEVGIIPDIASNKAKLHANSILNQEMAIMNQLYPGDINKIAVDNLKNQTNVDTNLKIFSSNSSSSKKRQERPKGSKNKTKRKK